MQRIAIAGATGYIGGRLAPRLLDAGYSLRCLVRSPRKLEERDWTSDPRVEVWHSTKAAARLMAAQAGSESRPVLLRLDFDAGHGIGGARYWGFAGKLPMPGVLVVIATSGVAPGLSP